MDDFPAAFDELFPRAYRLARRIVGDPTVAEDVAAEALARAYARWAEVAELPWRDMWTGSSWPFRSRSSRRSAR